MHIMQIGLTVFPQDWLELFRHKVELSNLLYILMIQKACHLRYLWIFLQQDLFLQVAHLKLLFILL